MRVARALSSPRGQSGVPPGAWRGRRAGCRGAGRQPRGSRLALSPTAPVGPSGRAAPAVAEFCCCCCRQNA
eukprot:13688927-Alexandrium_andersonii.AAC.1